MNPLQMLAIAEASWNSSKLLGGPKGHVTHDKMAREQKKKNRKKPKPRRVNECPNLLRSKTIINIENVLIVSML